MIYGSDISGWQPANVDLTGLDFVYVKATQGIYMSNMNHDAQVAQARATGVVAGHYHFPNWGDPVTEAQAFLIGAKWVSGDFMVLDIEASDQTPWPADPASWCVAFVREVYRQTGVWCWAYLGPLERPRGNYQYWLPLAQLSTLISPEYNNQGPSDPTPWDRVSMWQNADTNITGGDSDICYLTRAELVATGTPAGVTLDKTTVTVIPTYTPDQQFFVDLGLTLP